MQLQSQKYRNMIDVVPVDAFLPRDAMLARNVLSSCVRGKKHKVDRGECDWMTESSGQVWIDMMR